MEMSLPFFTLPDGDTSIDKTSAWTWLQWAARKVNQTLPYEEPKHLLSLEKYKLHGRICNTQEDPNEKFRADGCV